MKKLLTLALVGAMLTATGITAFAETTNVSYDVQPTYTVTIPATVDLGDNDVTAKIEASDVLLETGKKIKVDLTAASNTASGSTFNAKNGDSAVTYTISAGDKTIAVNDTVATFTADGSKTLTFSAADKSAATAAGAHTETLTFTIAVKDAKTSVSSVAIDDKSTTTLTKGNTLNLSATVNDAATDKTITWSSSDDTVASVDSTGKVTANKTGSAIITVTATNGTEDTADDKTDTITITVTNPANGITLNKTALALTKGGTETLTATVDPTDADGTVSWSSDDVTVATVDSNGKVTAVAPGTATITATIGSKSATCTVSVNNETLTLSHTTGTYFGLTASSTNSSGWRMYGGSTINISSINGKTIKKVELTIAGNGNSRNLNNFAVSSGTKTANGTTAGCIVTISDVNATTLTLTDNNSNAAKQYIFNKAVIYFE